MSRRSEAVRIAKSLLGLTNGSKAPAVIVDGYNECIAKYAQTVTNGLPRKAKMSERYPWCAATATVVQHQAGYAEDGCYEMSCGNLIKIAQKKNIWVENDGFVPSPGDLILYDWQDGSSYATTDNNGSPDHVGIVVDCDKKTITVIEGNYSNAVKERKLAVNGRYIRGFVHFEFENDERVEIENEQIEGNKLTVLNLALGAKGEAVRALQYLLNGRFNTWLDADGSFGRLTRSAVITAQINYGLETTGECNSVLWNHLING